MLLSKIRIHRIEEAKNVLDRKLTLLSSLLSSLKSEGLFKYKSLSVWLDAPLRSMGGALIAERDNIAEYTPLGLINYIGYLVREQPALRLVISIEGYVISNGKEFPAYITLYNHRILRQIYGDIEFDAYHYGDVEGLYNLYLSSEEFRRKIVRVIEYLGKSTPRPDIIVLGYSYDGLRILSDNLVIYRPKIRDFIIDIFRTLRALAEDNPEYKKYAKLITPYKEEFLAKTILEVPESTRVLSTIASKSETQLSLSSSVLAAGLSENALRNFVDTFARDIIDKVAQDLIDEDRVRKLITSVIKAYGRTKLF